MERAQRGEVLQFLKSVSTSTQCLEFMPEEKLAELDPHVAAHIEEIEDLLCRLSCEAEAMVWRAGCGHELYPHMNKRGGK